MPTSDHVPRKDLKGQGTEASPAYPWAQKNGAIGDLKQPGTTKVAKTQTSRFLGSWEPWKSPPEQ